jgi:hypothetical protein
MPKYKLILTSRAIKEIQSAVDYYNTRQKGLGRQFYADLKGQFSAIKLNPFSRLSGMTIFVLPC